MRYTFRIKSTFIEYLLFFAFLSPFAFFSKNFMINSNEILILIFFCLIGVGCYLIASFMAKGIAEVNLSNNQIEFTWLKRPIITTQSNQTIKVEDIDTWRFRKEYYYNYFIIHSKKSDNMILYRDSTWDDEKDDFASFLREFKLLIDNYNNGVFSREELDVIDPKMNSSNAEITNDESEFYKSRGSSFLFYFYILAIIMGIVGLITKWDQLSVSQNLLIISGILGCIFLINRHIRFKKK